MSKTELLSGREEILGGNGLFVDGDGQIVRGCEMHGPLTRSQVKARIAAHQRLRRRPPFNWRTKLSNDVGSFVGRDSSLDLEEIVDGDSNLDLEEIVDGDSNLGLEEIMGSSFLKKVDRLARKGLTFPFTGTSWTSQQIVKGLRALPSPLDVTRVFRSHVPGGTFVGRDEIVGSHTSEEDLALASEGSHSDRESLARHARSSSGYNSHWKYMRGDDRPTGDALEELKTRAAAGDPRALKKLAKLSKSTSGHNPTRRRPLASNEKNLIVKIRSAQERAQAGDISAQRQLTELRKEIPGLLSRAQSGDERARRHLHILKKLGVSQTS